jgi:hypothetical protein
MVSHFNSGESQNDDWDVVLLGGRFLPGFCTVDISLPSGLDVQKPKGANGATIRDEGSPPAELTIKTSIEEREELDALQAMVPILRPRAKDGARDPLSIVHPNANFWGITAVVIEEISSPQPTAMGGWIVTIKALEWFPAPKKAKDQKKSPTDIAQEQYLRLSPVNGQLGPTGVDILGPAAAEFPPSKTDAALGNLGLAMEELNDPIED